MKKTVAALRGATTHARFVLPVARHRQAYLGLRREALMRVGPERGARGTVEALLRGGTGFTPAPRRSPGPGTVQRPCGTTWSRSAATEVRARSRGGIAAPWRG